MITLDGEEIDVDYDPDDSFHQIVSHKPSSQKPSSPEEEVNKQVESTESVTEPTFAVMIQVERALHLPQMHDKQK